MPDARVTEVAQPARLLLIGGSGDLSDRLSLPLADELATPPVLVELGAGRPALYRPISWGEFRQKRADGDFADYGAEVQISDYRV